MGMFGMAVAVVTVAQTLPSTVYVIELGVQITPHVCHWVMSIFNEWLIWLFEEL